MGIFNWKRLKVCLCSQKLALLTGQMKAWKCLKVYHISAYCFFSVLSMLLCKIIFGAIIRSFMSYSLCCVVFIYKFTSLSLSLSLLSPAGCVCRLQILKRLTLYVSYILALSFMKNVGTLLVLNSWCLINTVIHTAMHLRMQKLMKELEMIMDMD
jgi:hypothetical protein